MQGPEYLRGEVRDGDDSVPQEAHRDRSTLVEDYSCGQCNLVPGRMRSYWSGSDYCRRFWDGGLCQCETPRSPVLKLETENPLCVKLGIGPESSYTPTLKEGVRNTSDDQFGITTRRVERTRLFLCDEVEGTRAPNGPRNNFRLSLSRPDRLLPPGF